MRERREERGEIRERRRERREDRLRVSEREREQGQEISQGNKQRKGKQTVAEATKRSREYGKNFLQQFGNKQ